MQFEKIINSTKILEPEKMFLCSNDNVWYSFIQSNNLDNIDLKNIIEEIYDTTSYEIHENSRTSSLTQLIAKDIKKKVNDREYFILTINSTNNNQGPYLQCLGYLVAAIDKIYSSVEIVMVHILNGVQGRMFGTNLVGTAESIARDCYNCTSIYLKTDTSFPGIAEFYSNLKYKVIQPRNYEGWTILGRNILNFQEQFSLSKEIISNYNRKIF